MLMFISQLLAVHLLFGFAIGLMIATSSKFDEAIQATQAAKTLPFPPTRLNMLVAATLCGLLLLIITIKNYLKGGRK